jgi:hypothetical protein
VISGVPRPLDGFIDTSPVVLNGADRLVDGVVRGSAVRMRVMINAGLSD